MSRMRIVHRFTGTLGRFGLMGGYTMFLLEEYWVDKLETAEKNIYLYRRGTE